MKVVKGKYKNGKVKLEKHPQIEGEVEVIVVFANKKKEDSKVEYEFDFDSQAFKEKRDYEQHREEQSRKKGTDFNFQDFFKEDSVKSIADVLKKIGSEIALEIRKNQRR